MLSSFYLCYIYHVVVERNCDMCLQWFIPFHHFLYSFHTYKKLGNLVAIYNPKLLILGDWDHFLSSIFWVFYDRKQVLECLNHLLTIWKKDKKSCFAIRTGICWNIVTRTTRTKKTFLMNNQVKFLCTFRIITILFSRGNVFLGCLLCIVMCRINDYTNIKIQICIKCKYVHTPTGKDFFKQKRMFLSKIRSLSYTALESVQR